MTNEEKILDKLDHALIMARDSTPPSLSPLLRELQKTLDNHILTHEADTKKINQDIIDVKNIIKPMTEAFDGKQGFWKMFFFIAKVAGATTAIIFLITGIIVFLKR